MDFIESGSVDDRLVKLCHLLQRRTFTVAMLNLLTLLLLLLLSSSSSSLSLSSLTVLGGFTVSQEITIYALFARISS